MTNSTLEQAPVVGLGSSLSQDMKTEGLDSNILVTFGLLLCHMLTWSNFWKLLLLASVLLNIKAFPFIYHLRLLNAVRFVLASQRPKRDVMPEQLFQPLITSSKACLIEIDVLGHKSNSTYFADADVARAHLITTMFGAGISKIRGGTTMNGLSGKPSSQFTVALGAVSCTFKKELRPYETYDMWTRILSWDDKWLYIITHFVRRGSRIRPKRYTLYPRQINHLENQDRKRESSQQSAKSAKEPSRIDGSSNDLTKLPICASALSKIVFKNGRITIRPRDLLEASNLLPLATTDGPRTQEKKNAALSEQIETERQRGLQQACLLGQQIGLENEFRTDVALGSHYDGLGVEGVVLTLAQLGKLSSYQLL